MRLISLEIPDEPAELAPWLERHLVGPDLAALVAELEAVHGEHIGAQPSVRGLIGRDLDAVMTTGLVSLSRTTLKRLLRQPRLLLDLQELVLVGGGRHWDRLTREASGEPNRQIDRGRKRLMQAIADDSASFIPDLLRMPRQVAWYRQPWFVSSATAASLLFAVFVYEKTRGPIAVASQGWGWSKPGALPQDLQPGPYLARLADDAEEWFKKRPDSPRALARRISEFREGCSTLILADHKPLPVADRSWLVGKCKEWAAKLDAHLAEIEAPGDLAKVQAEADTTIRKLVSALRNRASPPLERP